MKLAATLQVFANFLILLIKLIAILPKLLWIKCNRPLFSLCEVIFTLLMISICKPCQSLFVWITIKEILPLSVLVIKLEITTLLSGKVFSTDFVRSNNLPSTTLDGSQHVILYYQSNYLTVVSYTRTYHRLYLQGSFQLWPFYPFLNFLFLHC